MLGRQKLEARDKYVITQVDGVAFRAGFRKSSDLIHQIISRLRFLKEMRI